MPLTVFPFPKNITSGPVPPIMMYSSLFYSKYPNGVDLISLLSIDKVLRKDRISGTTMLDILMLVDAV